MRRDDIYDHLAQVYLGKRKKEDKKRQKQFSAWLGINIAITVMIFASVFYGLTAFLTGQSRVLKNNIVYSLSRGIVRIEYDFKNEKQPVETFSLKMPKLDASKYKEIQFKVRAKEEGNPGIVKVTVTNRRNETSSFYVQGLTDSWDEFTIPLDKFKEITDWTSLKDINFVLESWNVNKPRGIILIDSIRFST